jgi:hypothetical protein
LFYAVFLQQNQDIQLDNQMCGINATGNIDCLSDSLVKVHSLSEGILGDIPWPGTGYLIGLFPLVINSESKAILTGLV